MDTINDGSIFGAGIKEVTTSYPGIIGVTAIVSMLIILIILLLFITGYVQFGKPATVSKLTTSPVPLSILGRKTSNFTSPKWGTQGWAKGLGDAGSGSAIDIPGMGNSLGFGVMSKFTSPKSTQEHLEQLHHQNHQLYHANKQLQEQLLHKRAHFENFNNSSCTQAWDPEATEEAKALAYVGQYKTGSSGMAGLVKAVNDNTTLTDAQLEAIMQGTEPYQVRPLSSNEWQTLNSEHYDALAAQQRQHNITPISQGYATQH